MSEFVRLSYFLALPIFTFATLVIWWPGQHDGSFVGRITWTVFTLGICLMLNLALLAIAQETDGAFRPAETIRLHERLFFAFAAITIAAPVTNFLYHTARKRPADCR